MENITHILQTTKLFENIKTDTIVNTLIPNSTIRNYYAKECVIELLEKVNSIGVVLEGTLHLVQVFQDGNISLVEKLFPSYAIGSELVCTNTQKSPYSIVSATSSKIIYFPSSIFLKPGSIEETERSIIIDNLLTHLSQYNMRKYYRIAILSQYGIRDRILTYLSMQARKVGKKQFSVSLSREEMASYLCVNRSALSNELSKMKQAGLIDYNKNHFTLRSINLDVVSFNEHKPWEPFD